MAKRIIWSNRAQQDRKEILAYWIDRNKSKTYSLKLNQLFIQAVNLLSEHPLIGEKTEIENIRIKIVRDYYIT
jgi:plasmid stabilization system protein ParE